MEDIYAKDRNSLLSYFVSLKEDKEGRQGVPSKQWRWL